MKILVRLLFILVFMVGSIAKAENFRVLVLPVDLFANCENYYCFPGASEIFANDIIMELNKGNKVSAINLYDVKRKINDNSQLKQSVVYALNNYANNNVDFYALKKVSKAFNVKSVVLISSYVVQENTSRSIWEVLEVSSAFDAISKYNLQIKVVLTDNVNNIVMWNGKYNYELGNNEGKFWAKSLALASSHLERLMMYSQDILSKTVAQNITLRFYPKTVKQVVVPQAAKKPDVKEFKPNPLDEENIKKYLKENMRDEIETEMIYSL